MKERTQTSGPAGSRRLGDEEVVERALGGETPPFEILGVGAREPGHILEAAIDTLPAPFRIVFVLRQVEEMSTADTAAILDVPEQTVTTRLHRARVLLRRSLERSAGVTAPGAFAFGAARCDRVVHAVLARIEGRPLTGLATYPAWPGNVTGGES